MRTPTLRALAAFVITAASPLHAAEGWTEDFAKAQKTAADEGKDLLIDFTGSDWCGWCIRLQKEVFTKDAFKDDAPKHFVLVELDFPQQKEQADELKKQNAELQEKFGIEGFPTIVLADAKGRPYAKTGYQEGGPEKYVKHLAELRKVREERDEAMKKADAAEGLEKAKLIAAALDKIDDDVVEKFYTEEVDQIIALDKDDSLGMKKKKETAGKMDALNKDLETLGTSGKLKEFEERIEKFITDEKLEGEEKQQLMMQRLQVYGPDRLEEADKLMDAVIKIKADSDTATQAKAIKERIVEMKDQIDKSKKAEGSAPAEKEDK